MWTTGRKQFEPIASDVEGKRVFGRIRTALSGRHRTYRRLAAAVVGLAAVFAGVGVVASIAQADVAPPGTVHYQGILLSLESSCDC
ncbi:hypothetical protein [Micromonospora sp. NPDC023814]|uniref:hypothetical protein n=1 Tax=Micromonospora sp. NPDC023814 TaxID=3154596 RepID=UPI0034042C95